MALDTWLKGLLSQGQEKKKQQLEAVAARMKKLELEKVDEEETAEGGPQGSDGGRDNSTVDGEGGGKSCPSPSPSSSSAGRPSSPEAEGSGRDGQLSLGSGALLGGWVGA